jgi:hypothetical protein
MKGLDSPVSAFPQQSLAPELGLGAIRIHLDKQLGRDHEGYKSFRVSITDPCLKILPVVIKKFKLEEPWHKYALYVSTKQIERILLMDERPLDIQTRYKEMNDIPVFVIKQLKIEETADDSRVRNVVAVYPYKAERDDEIDVEIGDKFKVVKQEGGWVIVEKEARNYWIPFGCVIDDGTLSLLMEILDHR